MSNRFMSNLWRWKCGLPEIEEPKPQKPVTIAEVYAENWCSEFEQFMRNRLAMGYFRYGPLSKQKKGQYDAVGSAISRLQRYQKEGNDEILVDVANLCMVEYVKGVHPNKHFKAEDDVEHATKLID